ncbi:MAG TPA: stage II sporulation protein E [Geobacter sp.]|nr:stage II sporulation protein E [Geobacter sp.]
MSQETSVAKLAGIGKKCVYAAKDLQVQALLGIFQDDPALLTIPIIDESAFLGTVSRKDFLNLLSRPFAMELYAKKPVLALLEDLKGKKIAFPPDLEINEAAVQLLSLDPTLQTDAFPLVENGRCTATVAVADLMMAVAEQQRELLHALDRLSSRIREEVACGVKVQQDLLPAPDFSFGAVTIGAGITTCSEIGGDFFDYFSIGDHILGLVIADVSGHGVQSGMVTTAAKASLHTLISLGVTTPSGLLAGMNNAILATTRRTLLMTCLIASIDLSSHTVTIANAGHNFPLMLRGGAGKAEMLETTAGFPLGFERDAQFPEVRTGFFQGDALFMYTDGIVESANAGGEEFGYDRLMDLLLRERDVHPTLLHDTLLDRVAAFTRTGVFDDDVTTLVARFDTTESSSSKEN